MPATRIPGPTLPSCSPRPADTTVPHVVVFTGGDAVALPIADPAFGASLIRACRARGLAAAVIGLTAAEVAEVNRDPSP